MSGILASLRITVLKSNQNIRWLAGDEYRSKKGVIEDVKIFGDFFSERGIDEIEQALVGVHHEEKAIRGVLSRFDIGQYFSNITVDNLIEAMF